MSESGTPTEIRIGESIILVIDGVPPLLAREPDLDVKLHAKELATVFAHATRRQSS